MKPYYADEAVTLHHGDSLTVLSSLRTRLAQPGLDFGSAS